MNNLKNDGTLKSAYAIATCERDRYRNWLCRKIDEALEWNEVMGEDDNISHLEAEIEALEAGDHGFNAWFTHPQLDDEEERTLAIDEAMRLLQL